MDDQPGTTDDANAKALEEERAQAERADAEQRDAEASDDGTKTDD